MTKLTAKIFTHLASLLIFIQAHAASFTVLPNEIQSGCRSNTLYAEIGKLENFTYSRTKLVEVETNSFGICHAAKQALGSQAPMKVEVKSELQSLDSLVRIDYCNSGMEKCTALYRKSVLENIEVRINQIVLYKKTEVPGSREDYIVEWDPKYCPPYAPDCDL